MANLKDLIVNGAARFIGKVYASEFVGKLTGDVTGNVSNSYSCSGNASTATTLQTSRTINGTFFDGSANITTANWGAARNIFITDGYGANTGDGISVNGSGNTTLRLPATIKASINGNASSASQANQIKTTAATNNRAYYLSFTDAAATYNNLYTNTDITCNPGTGTLKAPRVEGAVCNDLADSIPLGEGDTVEPGYCYCFDGEHYTKTSAYMQQSYIGIHSDTYGFRMGYEEGKEKLDVAVSGFVLAYVDKDYPVGTPLTCTKDGYLTEISKEDKRDNPEMVIAKYWKSEPNEEWGIDNKKVKVNGRRWIKIK